MSAACDSIESDLAKSIAQNADEARGNAKEALNKFAEQCRARADSLPSVAKNAAASFCDALATGS